jgi:hypothetical protein
MNEISIQSVIRNEPTVYPHILDIWNPDPNKKYLVVGKGPSFQSRKINDFCDRNNFGLISLNNSCDGLKHRPELMVCHDLAAVTLWGELIYNCDLVALPVYPHLPWQVPNPSRVEYFVETNRYLREMRVDRRLGVFDLRSAVLIGKRLFPNHPYMESIATIFETAVQLLALKGIKHFYTIGVDGGTQTHEDFKVWSDYSNPYSGQDPQVDSFKKKWGLTIEPI